MSEHDPLEEFFRDRAENEIHPFNEKDWEALEARLDREMPVRGGNFWGMVLAAVLLMSIPWWPWSIEGPEPYDPSTPQIAPITTIETPQEVESKTLLESDEVKNVEADKTSVSESEPASTTPSISTITPRTATKPSERTYTLTRADESTLMISPLGYRIIPEKDVNTTEPLGVFATPVPYATSDDLVSEDVKTDNLLRSWRPYVLTGFEYSGTQMNNAPQLGYRLGAGVRYFPIEYISIAAGVNYSRVNYSCYGDEYETDAELPYGLSLNWTDGYCEMVEFPLEVRVHPTSWLNFGAGLRSYVIVGQKYDHYLNNEFGPDVKVPYESWEATSAFAGHLKFNMGFALPIGSRYQLELQPFYQIPLRGLGAGNVRWNTAGASLTFLF